MLSFLRHISAFLLTVGAFCLIIFAPILRPQASLTFNNRDFAIAVQHAKPQELFVDVTSKFNHSLVQITNDDVQDIELSVSDLWQRGEVQNVRIEDLHTQEPIFGFQTFSLPPKSGIQFTYNGIVERLRLHHPSTAVLTVHLKEVDVVEDTIQRTVFLAQGGIVNLWEE